MPSRWGLVFCLTQSGWIDRGRQKARPQTHSGGIGGFGGAEVFSLSVTKALVCGEGHRDGAQRQACPSTRRHGCVNITRLDAVLAQRQATAARYRAWLAEAVPQVGFAPVPAGVISTWKDFNVLLDARLASRRSEIAASPQAQGVETRGYFSSALRHAGVAGD